MLKSIFSRLSKKEESELISQFKKSQSFQESLIENFKEYINNLEGRIAVICHKDVDGICSAAIFSSALRKIKKKEVIMFKSYNYDKIFQDNLIKEIISKDIKRVIFLDMDLEKHINSIKKIQDFAQILIVDHHPSEISFSLPSVLIITSQMLKKNSYYPTSLLIYDLFCKIENISELDWIAAIGIISDNCYEHNSVFVNSVIKKYRFSEEKNIWDTTLGKAAKKIYYSLVYDKTNDILCYNTLLNSKSIENLSKLDKFYNIIEKEVSFYLDFRNSEFELYPELNLAFMKIIPKHDISSIIANILSKEKPNRTLIVITDTADKLVKISLRRQDCKIAMNELVKKATENLKEGSGGGHIASAGGYIRREDIQKFKNNVINLLK